MEHPREEMIIQRMLALILGAAVAAVAVIEHRSPLAQAVAAGRPRASWLALASGPEKDTPFLYLQVYDPMRKTLDLIYVPDTTKGIGGKAISTAYDAALAADAAKAADRMAEAAAAVLPRTADRDWTGLPLSYELTALPGACEPADRAKAWLQASLASPKSWLRLSSFDRFLLALELSRLRPAAIRPAWLPEEGQRAAFFEHLLAPDAQTPPPERAITVEIFNCSGQAGLASQAKKVLRLKGADVVTTGNSALLETRTIVYDRTGRHNIAQTVRAMLGCETALAVTQIDPKRLVDVSVLLADDCPLQ